MYVLLVLEFCCISRQLAVDTDSHLEAEKEAGAGN
jgi:hypothetical protein